MTAKRHHSMRESDLQRLILDAARLYSWRVAHFRPARTAQGWRTPVSADAAGFPDLVLVHPRRGIVAFVELKAQRGAVRPEQKAWAEALGAVEGVEYRLWRPADIDDALGFLRGY